MTKKLITRAFIFHDNNNHMVMQYGTDKGYPVGERIIHSADELFHSPLLEYMERIWADGYDTAGVDVVRNDEGMVRSVTYHLVRER